MKARQLIKKLIPRKLFEFIKDLLYPEKINVLEKRLETLFISNQTHLVDPKFNQKIILKNSEFKVYSKHGGDGILAYIFSKVGVTNRIFVEIGVEDGRQCNTSNLSLNFGWNGLMIDANAEWLEKAKVFFKKILGEHANNVKHIQSLVSAENINETISKGGLVGEIDLFSLDIDGNDYWVWKSLNVINPRVVILEYNSAFGNNSVTISYDDEFRYKPKQNHPLYFGASLSALSKLSKEKGYILVGCDTNGHDAFFVRKDLMEGKFVELAPDEAFYPNPFNLNKFGSIESQFDQIKGLNLTKI